MHKFIDNIVAFSLKNKFFVFFCRCGFIQTHSDRCISRCDEYESDHHYPVAGTQCRRGREVYYDSGGDSHEFGTEEDRYPFDNLVWVVSHQCAV